MWRMPCGVSGKRGLMTPGSSLSSGSSMSVIPLLRVGFLRNFASKQLQALRNQTIMPGVSPLQQDFRPGSGPEDSCLQ